MPSLSNVIPFADKRHRMLVSAIRERVTFSDRKMQEYSDKWRDAEDRFTAYIKVTEVDKKRNLRKADGEPLYTTIHVPHSYGMLMAAHTYWTSVFLSRNPVFQFQGRHGEAARNVEAVDAIIDYQVNVGRHLVPFYIWLLDPGRYGFGVLWNWWADETSFVSQIVEEAQTDALGTPIGTRRRTVVLEVPGYKGNRGFNVQPWDFLPDPRVPLSRIQEGEWVGRKFALPWAQVLARKAKGLYFNLEELKRVVKQRRGAGTGSVSINAGDERTGRGEGSLGVNRPDTEEVPAGTEGIPEIGYVHGVEMVVTLIPREWQISESPFPEKWVFTVAEDEVLIGLTPLGAYHNQYPCAVLEYEPEGYGFIGQGMLERVDPLNQVLNWLTNSHFYNVRAALANQFIYDPSRLYEEDVLSTDPGKFIRLRPEAYGTDIRTLIQQLPVADVTRSHLQDGQAVTEVMQRLTGVNETIMGALNPGGRKTATEVRSSSSFGINRLKTAAEFFSAEGFAPLAQLMLQNTQQYYDQQMQFRIAGDQINTGEPFVSVTPESIQGFFDFTPVDGTLPIDKLAMANLWRQMLMDMAQIPAIATQYNLGGIFEFTAQMAGLKGVKQFRTQVLPDVELARLAQEGNVVPFSPSGGGSPVATDAPTQAPEPRRLPDTGRTQ